MRDGSADHPAKTSFAPSEASSRGGPPPACGELAAEGVTVDPGSLHARTFPSSAPIARSDPSGEAWVGMYRRALHARPFNSGRARSVRLPDFASTIDAAGDPDRVPTIATVRPPGAKAATFGVSSPTSI